MILVNPLTGCATSHGQRRLWHPQRRLSMNLELAAKPSLAAALRERIETRTARVAVVGLGYVGLPLAETFAWGGYPVLGFDTDPEKVKKLRTGQSYIGHISSERVAELVDGGRFEATFNPN